MMGGNIIKEENQPLSTYLQDKDQRAITCGSDEGPSRRSVTYTQYPLHPHNIPVSSDNLVVDLNQLYTEQTLLPDLNSIDMTSNMSNLNWQGFYYPGWNLDELPIDAHKTVVSDSLISEQSNNLIDKKESTGMFYDNHGGDISVQNNHEASNVESDWPCKIDGDFLSLGIGDSTEAKSEYSVNWNGGTGKPLNSFDVQKAIVGFSGPGHSFVSTSFNDNARSVYGSYANPDSSQFDKLQKTVPDMLREYPTSSIGNPGIRKLEDNLGANLDHQKRLGGELAVSPGQFSSDSSSGLSEFGNNFSYPLKLESVGPICTNTQPSNDQVEMRYMQTVKSFASESSTVSSATEVRGSSIKQENAAGRVSASVSLAAHAANKTPQFLKKKLVQPGRVSASVTLAAQAADKTPQFLKRKLVQPDGSIYGVNANVSTIGAEVCQFPNSTRVQASEGSVQGKLITHSENVGLSQASDVVGSSSRKRAAKQPPPSAPKVQRKKTTVSSPVMMPPVTYVPSISHPAPPKVERKNKIYTYRPSTPIIAPSPAAPRVQRTKMTVPPSVVFTRPSASTVQINNVTASPPVIPSASAQNFQLTQKMVPKPAMPYPPSVAPRPLPAQNFRLTQKMVPKPAMPPVFYPPSVAPPAAFRPRVTNKAFPQSVQPPVAPVVLNPRDPRAQLSNIKVPSPVIKSIPNIPSAVPAPLLPASPHHIKWKDPDELPPPLGERCMICKRDLLFTAEGPVFQPAFRPEAAVLPCGHTFHALCLEKITPGDQAADPPCIPCAIGEI